VDETGKVFMGSATSEEHKNASKTAACQIATVLLPFLCFAVERRVKNKFCLPLTRNNPNVKFPLRKENLRRTIP
jgi:hypothetical protein